MSELNVNTIKVFNGSNVVDLVLHVVTKMFPQVNQKNNFSFSNVTNKLFILSQHFQHLNNNNNFKK